MMKNYEIKRNVLFIDGNDFASDIFMGCKIQGSNLGLPRRWLTFDSNSMDIQIGKKIEEIIECILNLRKQQKDEKAIDLSDAFFQSFTPAMNILIEQKSFIQVSNMWFWIILKVKEIEEKHRIEFGKGVHKGTAFYFLGFNSLMMGDVDGSYLAFAEAAKEDEISPQTILNRHQKTLPPVVKILLLDLSKDNFAYNIVKEIRETIKSWEQNHSNISRSTSIFTSTQNAIDKNAMPRDSAIHIFYAFTKAFYTDSRKKSFLRPTFLTITQVGNNILTFVRTLEDFIRISKNLNKNINIFNYCHDTWFSYEDWNVSSYENDIEGLLNDFINNKWNLSKDGSNLLFSFKVRNALAHRIPNDRKLFENHIEMILAISSSFGFICDKIVDEVT